MCKKERPSKMFILHIIIIGGGEIVDDIQSGITIPET